MSARRWVLAVIVAGWTLIGARPAVASFDTCGSMCAEPYFCSWEGNSCYGGWCFSVPRNRYRACWPYRWGCDCDGGSYWVPNCSNSVCIDVLTEPPVGDATAMEEGE